MTVTATATHRPTPLDLLAPRVPRIPRIALIDADNLVIGSDERIHSGRAIAALDEVYAELSSVELTLAVMSQQATEQLPRDLRMRYPNWEWRPADAGKDAADHQLLDFAYTVLRQRPGALVAVASGDGIFAELLARTEIEVVVPQGHPGLSNRLRPYLRLHRSHDLTLAA